MEQLQPPAQWSDAVEEASWIADRLTPSRSHSVTSVVPAGFGAYARVLHPAEEPRLGERLVRWHKVAAWSGEPLRPDSQFHTVALPKRRPPDPAPWSAQGPRQGSLYAPDADVLAEVLRGFTAAPDQCWFCIWDGYGWEGRQLLSSPGTTSVILPDPVPEAVRQGPRVRLPGRDYLLYEGPVEAITAPAMIGHGQTANLAWPADHVWCLGSEIDLAWTYIAGSAALIDRLLSDERVEVLPAAPDDPLTRIEPFVAGLVERAVAELLSSGHAVIATARGTVEASLQRPTRFGSGALRVRHHGENGVEGTGGSVLHGRDEPALSQEIAFRLTLAVIDLVGG